MATSGLRRRDNDANTENSDLEKGDMLNDLDQEPFEIATLRDRIAHFTW